MDVTLADLSAVAGKRVRSGTAEQFVKAVNKYAADFEVNTPARMALFLAHCHVEMGAFARVVENLNYSVAGLKNTFGRHRISSADAERYGRKTGRPANQEAIANLIYGGPWGKKNLGNTDPGDGWRFRGSGPGQVTGRANFQRVQDATGLPVVDRPDVLRDVDSGTRATFVLWQAWNMNAYADKGEVTASRRKWNGGSHGLAEVKAAYARGLKRDYGLVNRGGDEPNVSHDADANNLTYTNQSATRNRKVTANLERKLSEAVLAVYGPDARAEIYSGGQAKKGTSGKRVGSVRHDDHGKGGRAADVYVYDGNNQRLTGIEVVKLGQYWLAKKNGCVGALMGGGGIHLDEWTTPPSGGGYLWTYAASNREPWGSKVRPMLMAGHRGEMPELAPEATAPPSPPNKAPKQPETPPQQPQSGLIDALLNLLKGLFK